MPCSTPSDWRITDPVEQTGEWTGRRKRYGGQFDVAGILTWSMYP